MDYEVDVRVASRPLTERERQQLTVYLHKGANGTFDIESLFDWDINDLVSWGFDDIGELADAAQITEVGEVGEHKDGNNRDLGSRHKQIKPVIYADDVMDFERAILATGIRNRGDAIMTICRFYLEQHGDGKAEGQFNFTFENFVEA